ncbi:MAG: thiolase family protein [Bacillota bacterium]
MREVFIVGVGMTRFGKYLDGTIKGMTAEAVEKAIKDAGIGVKDIEAAYFSNSFWGMYSDQHSIKGQVALRPLGIEGIPVINTENACAGATTAFYLAHMAVASGMFDVALAVGAEKISHENKAFSFKAYTSALDVENAAAHMQSLLDLNKKADLKIQEDQAPPGQGRSVFMDIYAAACRMHMAKYGTTQRQLALIASKNHFHGSLNPLAQIQKDMTVEEILADPLVSYPLTRAMCSPVGDGAAAAVLCSRKFLKKLAGPRPVKVRACVLGSGMDNPSGEDEIGARLSRQAYSLAGAGPEDMDLAEVHDATAFGELHQTEALGFCAKGEGGLLAESGATRLGGRIPINTSGGLESRGHPIGASGLAMVHELVTQLRGEAGPRQVEGARLGLGENGGGNIGLEEAAMVLGIFESVRRW